MAVSENATAVADEKHSKWRTVALDVALLFLMQAGRI